MSSDHDVEFGVPTVESLLKLHAAVDVISKMQEGTLPATYAQFVPEVDGLLLERQSQYGLKRGKDADGKKKGAWTLQSICVSFSGTWTADAFPYLQPLRSMSDLCRDEANPAAIKKAVHDAEQTQILLDGFVSSFKLLMKSEVAPHVPSARAESRCA